MQRLAGADDLLQLVAAIAFLTLMRFEGMLTPNLYVPFWGTHLILSWPVYMIFAAFVIVGTVNAVNITDGIDGLAGSVTVSRIPLRVKKSALIFQSGFLVTLR